MAVTAGGQTSCVTSTTDSPRPSQSSQPALSGQEARAQRLQGRGNWNALKGEQCTCGRTPRLTAQDHPFSSGAGVGQAGGM